MGETIPAEWSTNEDFGWALGVLLRAYRDRIGPALGGFPHGMRGYQTLSEVVRGQPPSQLALANRLGIDRTVMTYLIDGLVEAGLVERRLNPLDRRQRQIVATPRGRQAVAALCRQAAEAEDAVLGALDEQERAVFRRLLRAAACGRPEVDRSGDPCEVVNEVIDAADR